MAQKTGQSPFSQLTNAYYGWVISRPRIVRFIFAILVAAGAVYLIFPAIDSVYLQNFVSFETVMVPSLISAVIGIAIFAYGYWAIVGFPNEKPTVSRAPFYIIVGTLVVLLAFMLFVQLIANVLNANNSANETLSLIFTQYI